MHVNALYIIVEPCSSAYGGTSIEQTLWDQDNVHYKGGVLYTEGDLYVVGI